MHTFLIHTHCNGTNPLGLFTLEKKCIKVLSFSNMIFLKIPGLKIVRNILVFPHRKDTLSCPPPGSTYWCSFPLFWIAEDPWPDGSLPAMSFQDSVQPGMCHQAEHSVCGLTINEQSRNMPSPTSKLPKDLKKTLAWMFEQEILSFCAKGFFVSSSSDLILTKQTLQVTDCVLASCLFLIHIRKWCFAFTCVFLLLLWH